MQMIPVGIATWGIIITAVVVALFAYRCGYAIGHMKGGGEK